MLTDEMRRLIALLEQHDDDEDEAYDVRKVNDAVEQMRRERIIRQNPPKLLAKTQLGDLYQLSTAMACSNKRLAATFFHFASTMISASVQNSNAHAFDA